MSNDKTSGLPEPETVRRENLSAEEAFEIEAAFGAEALDDGEIVDVTNVLEAAAERED